MERGWEGEKSIDAEISFSISSWSGSKIMEGLPVMVVVALLVVVVAVVPAEVISA